MLRFVPYKICIQAIDEIIHMYVILQDISTEKSSNTENVALDL